jgi:GTP pyrophosphokinase
VRVAQILQAAHLKQATASPHHSPIIHKRTTERTRGFQVGDTQDLLTRIARCCKPIPGDAIIGFITQGRGVSIHKKACTNILHYQLNSETRLIEVTWDEKHPGGYYADLQIRAYGKDQILKEITSLVANAKIDVVMLNSSINKTNNMTMITMTLQIHDLLQLTQLIHQIKHLSHVIDVKRIGE